MRIAFVVIALSGLVLSASAQMTLDTTLGQGLTFGTGSSSPTTERLRISQFGNVGVSNTNPIAKLDVWGSISASDAIQVGQSNYTCINAVSGSIRYNTASDTLQICTGSGWKSLVSASTGTLTGTGSATAVAFWNNSGDLTYDSSATNGFYYDNVNKRLGIGINAPALALEISSSQSNASSIRVRNNHTAGNSAISMHDNNGNATGYIGYSNAAASLNPGTFWLGSRSNTVPMVFATGTGDLERMRLTGAGYVGIGTATPTATLQVSGSFIVSSTNQTNSPSVYVTSGGLVGIGNDAPSLTLTVSGSMEASSYFLKSTTGLVMNGNSVTVFLRSKNGTSTQGAAINMNNQDEPSFPNALILGAGSSTGGKSLYILGTGAMGFGTTAPGASLTVVGEVQVSNSSATCAANTNGGAIRYTSGTGIQYCGGNNSWTSLSSDTTTVPVTGSGAANHVAYWSGATGLTYDNGQLYWDATNNRLGIGMTPVSYNIDISGSTNANMRLLAASGATAGIILSSNFYNVLEALQVDLDFAVPTSRNFKFRNNGVVKLIIDSAGSVSGSTFKADNNDSASLPGHTWDNDTNTGMYHAAADTIGFTTAGTERTRILSTGEVGIGTTTPSEALTVSGKISTTGEIIGTVQFKVISNLTSPSVILRNDGANFYALLTNNSDPYGTWNSLRPFNINVSTGDVTMANNNVRVSHASGQISATNYLASPNDSNSAPGYSWGGDTNTGMFRAAADTIGFSTGGSEAMRIDSAGNVSTTGKLTNGGFDFMLGSADQVTRGNSGSSRALVKYTGNILGVNWGGDFTGGTAIYASGNVANLFVSAVGGGNIGIGTTSPAAKLDVVSSTAGVAVARFQNGTGTCTFAPASSGSGTWSCSSDARLKTDIADTQTKALDYFSGLRIRDYTMKSDGSRQTGVIAQEVRTTHADLVHEGQDGLYTVDEPNKWLLVKAIQELKVANDNLSRRLKAVERKLAR